MPATRQNICVKIVRDLSRQLGESKTFAIDLVQQDDEKIIGGERFIYKLEADVNLPLLQSRTSERNESLLNTGDTENITTFLVFPNPASKILNVLSPAQDGLVVQITDITGRVLGSYQSRAMLTLDVRSFAAGLYFVSWINAKGEKIKSSSFVVNPSQ